MVFCACAFTEDKEETVAKMYISELKNIRLRLEECEQRLIQRIQSPVSSRTDKDGRQDNALRIAEQEVSLCSKVGALRLLSRAAAFLSVPYTYVIFCDMVTVSHVTPQIVWKGSGSAMGSDVHFSRTFFSKSLLNSLPYCFCFMFWFSDHEACRILAPQQGDPTHTPLHWKAKA